MKKKKLVSKLLVKKSTIANLDYLGQKLIKGGTGFPTTGGDATIYGPSCEPTECNTKPCQQQCQ